MKLSDFISQSISEIALGVSQAKIDTRDLISVAPGTLNRKILTDKTEIDFEIAITTSKKSVGSGVGGAKAGFEISVLSSKVSAGVDGTKTKESTDSEEKISKLNFKVPVYLNAHHRSDNDTEDGERAALEALKKKLSS